MILYSDFTKLLPADIGAVAYTITAVSAGTVGANAMESDALPTVAVTVPMMTEATALGSGGVSMAATPTVASTLFKRW